MSGRERLFSIAREFRSLDPDTPAGGYVTVFRGKGCGWICDTVRCGAERFEPDVYAVPDENEEGAHIFKTVGGGPMKGAQGWTIYRAPGDGSIPV